MNYVLGGLVFWGLLLSAVWMLRPGSKLLGVTMETQPGGCKTATIITLVILIWTSGVLISLCPFWRGELEVTEITDGKISVKMKKNPEDEEPTDHTVVKNKNQYELMAEALLDGKLYLDYDDVDSRLLEMENPYDTAARKEQKIHYHWDHAFYDGRYYVYFGIVPVLLLFLPFRVITGTALTTYHATQIFVGAAIIGLFFFFRLLAKKYFPKIPIAVYLLLGASVSLASMAHCIAKPAMYMTAFSAGICMEIWSLYFYMKAVWATEDENRALLTAFFGALLGALAFGCRPPIALANIVVIPCLVHFLRGRRITRELLLKLLAAASPYIVIGILLMLYNYVRFDSPFEFGQKYQLTVADQSEYGDLMLKLTSRNRINGLIYLFLRSRNLSEEFPFITDGGIFFTYPVLGTGLFAVTSKRVRAKLRESGLKWFVLTGVIAIWVISMMDIVWSPYLLARYKEDISWLIGMLVFITVGMKYADRQSKDESVEDTREFSFAISLLAIFAIFMFIAVFVRLDMEYFTEDQLAWIMDTFMHLRLGIPLPVIETG